VGVVDAELAKKDLCFNNLCDNRDFSVFRCLSAQMTEKIELNKTISFQHNIKWIKLRRLLIHTLIASFHLASKTLSKKEDTKVTTNGISCEKDYSLLLHQLLTELKEYHNSLKEEKLILDQVLENCVPKFCDS
jgi:hypothetical protein